jgi:hypothetical protein
MAAARQSSKAPLPTASSFLPAAALFGRAPCVGSADARDSEGAGEDYSSSGRRAGGPPHGSRFLSTSNPLVFLFLADERQPPHICPSSVVHSTSTRGESDGLPSYSLWANNCDGAWLRVQWIETKCELFAFFRLGLNMFPVSIFILFPTCSVLPLIFTDFRIISGVYC